MLWVPYYMILVYLEKCVAIGTLPPAKNNHSLQIETQNGLIQGDERKSINGEVYFSYVGIPYAKPPVNELRFKNPKPTSNWTGVLDATVQGPCCAGLNMSDMVRREFSVLGKEDCLFLNVYAPQATDANIAETPFAVMVFIHGGAFFSGCGNGYGADYFIENNIVLVIPNYRISIFGYLSTEDMECPGNWAAKDQIAALRWVQANIRKFGGDPARVTIFGQSSGAADVNILLLSPKAKGLFHRAIMMSGSSLSYWAYQTQQKKVAFDVGVALGIETNSSKILMEELRKIDTTTIIQGQINPIIVNLMALVTNGLPVTPSVEPNHKEAVLMDYPYAILEKGQFNRVPIMMGVTTAEGVLYRQIIRMIKPFLILFNLSPGLFTRMTRNPENRSIVAGKILNHFLNTTDILKASEEDLSKFISEDGYFRPLRKTASLAAKYSPVYFYEFSYEGELGIQMIQKLHGVPELSQRDFKGVSHSEDLAYLFTSKKMDLKSYKKYATISKKLSKLYTNFAKTGNPTPFRDPFLDNVTWPRVTTEKFPYLNLGQHFTEVRDNFDEKNFQFWEDLYNKYSEKPYKVY